MYLHDCDRLGARQTDELPSRNFATEQSLLDELLAPNLLLQQQ